MPREHVRDFHRLAGARRLLHRLQQADGDDSLGDVRFRCLAGFEAPQFETQQEFTVLGTSYRVHWHVGAGPVDWRGAWKNPGQ